MSFTTIPFGRLIRLGSRGTDTQGVQRALARAGYGKLGGLLPVFGPVAVWNLKRFQRASDALIDGVDVVADGIYGPVTHKYLTRWFDDYAFLLYTGHPPPHPNVYLHLPAAFTPTHETLGLPGYPAIDVFAQPGAIVTAPADGEIRRLSGHDPREGGERGGAYGWSMYLTCEHGEYFLTHFATREVTVGQAIGRGDRLGSVCDAKVAHMPSSLSHIHEGLKLL